MPHSIITMPSLSVKAAVLLAITLFFREIETHGDIRVDEEPIYFKDQDIYQAFNISKGFWLHTQNFERQKTGGRRCTYFQIQSIDENGMNYTSYYLFADNTKGKMPYHGIFYQTPPVSTSERNKRNGLNVSETSEPWHPRNFRLTYSDYKSCLILRVLDFERMNGYACMVLVSDSQAHISMPSTCQHAYRNACNGSGIAEQIYEKSCKKPQLQV
uniref:Putative lipocalin-2 1 n=1 Tax=Amblyomma cajennense TaxID=34607 RepID=A0A023FR17_AMBCJ